MSRSTTTTQRRGVTDRPTSTTRYHPQSPALGYFGLHTCPKVATIIQQ
jgi:hypothetical protein